MKASQTINTAIAKWLGYEVEFDGNNYHLLDPSGNYIDRKNSLEERAWQQCPDFATDWCAVLEILIHLEKIAQSISLKYEVDIEVNGFKRTGWSFYIGDTPLHESNKFNLLPSLAVCLSTLNWAGIR